MATIGTFTRTGDGFTGTVSTLTLDAKVQVRPAEKSSDKAPDFRIFAGRAEIGAAWKKTSNEGRDYLSVKLDDPSRVIIERLATSRTDAGRHYEAGVPAEGAKATLPGGKQTMIGNLIAPQFGAQFNWPLGAAMSIVMLLAAVAVIYLFRLLVALWSRQ